MAIASKLLKALLKGSKPKPKGNRSKGKITPAKASKANTEDFYGVEFDLKARGMSAKQKKALAKEMGFDSVPKGNARDLPTKSYGPKTDPRNLARLKAAAEKPKTQKSNKPETSTAKTGSNELQKLQYEYDGLKPTARNAERKMGSKSKFYPVFKELGFTKMKDGGGVSKAMGEDRTRSPKGYDATSQAKKPVVKKKHGGKVVSGNDGNSIVAGCYD